MIDEKDYELAFKIISIAGESRSKSMMAVSHARKGAFDKAEELIKEANDLFLESHEVQTEMLVEETRGNKQEVNIFMVHAQDHLTMATITLDNAKEFIYLYKKIGGIKNED